MAVTTRGYKVGKQPIAQSFYVSEPTGIYCTKFDLFFKAADENAPIQVEVRPMVNGFPSAIEILPGSVKALPGSTFTGGASVSNDASVATSFELDEPIFLKGRNDYALVITADSKDYEIYIAQINEFVVGSTEKRVNKQPTLGSLFYSQNGTTFTPAQNQDLTFRIHKAKFKNTTATVRLNNASVPKQLLKNNPITTTNGSQTVKVFHPHHGMQVGQPVTLAGVDSNGVGGIFASTLNKRYNISAADYTGYTFTADSAADSDAIGGGTLVTSTKNIPYSTIFPNIQTLVPNNTAIGAEIKTTTGKSFAGGETAFQKSPTFKSLKILENSRLTTQQIVAHDSAETSELGAGVKSIDMNIQMVGIDSNVAPMVDLQRSSLALINNVIDKQASTPTSGFNVPLAFVNETSKTGGSAASKHLTRIINLENESVGLKVFITANRPSEADFQVFVRTAGDDEIISEKDFILLSQENTIPSDENPRFFRNYTYLHGGLGGDIPAFLKYQFKIVLRSTNQAKPPIIRSLRVISLSV
tara:strand:- start:127 stop:1710 length:1584 start_codon:yes stop_codon:yes gene_type:complete